MVTEVRRVDEIFHVEFEERRELGRNLEGHLFQMLM